MSQRKCASRKCRSIEDFCDIGKNHAIYKYARPSKIASPKKLVRNVVEVLVEYSINLFGVNVDIDHLVYPGPGMHVTEENERICCLFPIKEKNIITPSSNHV